MWEKTALTSGRCRDHEPCAVRDPPPLLGSAAARREPAMAGAKMARFGDEGEAMLFVVGYWGRCGLGDGEEMSLW